MPVPFRRGALIGQETTSVVDEKHGLVKSEGAEITKSGGAARDQPAATADGPPDGDLTFGLGRSARSRVGSHTFECVVGFGGKAHHDAIPGHDPAARYDYAHDPGLAHDLAVVIASKDGVEQTWL
jgi:hypothetical protein